jgi:uncharacterized membrane protein HdeD (DUF308 family)
MKTIKTVQHSVKNWYILLIVGLIFLGAGIYAFLSPAESFLALSLLFAWSFLISGAIEIAFSISNREELENWGWTLIFGVITFLVGLLLLARPEITMITLSLSLGFLVLFRSIGAISFALDLKSYDDNSGWGTLLALGILGVLFSFLLLWNPAFAGSTIVFWTGLALVIAGIFSIYLSLKLRKLKGVSQKVSSELRERFASLQEEIQSELDKTKS